MLNGLRSNSSQSAPRFTPPPLLLPPSHVNLWPLLTTSLIHCDTLINICPIFLPRDGHFTLLFLTHVGQDLWVSPGTGPLVDTNVWSWIKCVSTDKLMLSLKRRDTNERGRMWAGTTKRENDFPIRLIIASALMIFKPKHILGVLKSMFCACRL